MKLLIIILLFAGAVNAQDIGRTETFNRIQREQILFRAQQLELERAYNFNYLNNLVVRPLTIFDNVAQQPTIIIQNNQMTQPILQPALNVYQINQRGQDCAQNKVDRPFVPVYIHLNLNNR